MAIKGFSMSATAIEVTIPAEQTENAARIWNSLRSLMRQGRRHREAAVFAIMYLARHCSAIDFAEHDQASRGRVVQCCQNGTGFNDSIHCRDDCRRPLAGAMISCSASSIRTSAIRSPVLIAAPLAMNHRSTTPSGSMLDAPQQPFAERALALLPAHWRAVDALACALIANRRIEGEDVEGIIDGVMSRHRTGTT